MYYEHRVERKGKREGAREGGESRGKERGQIISVIMKGFETSKPTVTEYSSQQDHTSETLQQHQETKYSNSKIMRSISYLHHNRNCSKV